MAGTGIKASGDRTIQPLRLVSVHHLSERTHCVASRRRYSATTASFTASAGNKDRARAAGVAKATLFAGAVDKHCQHRRERGYVLWWRQQCWSGSQKSHIRNSVDPGRDG